MFEKEIKFIIDFTLNRISKLGSVFPFERLAAAEIHPAILLYISAHLDYLIYEDRKKLLMNSSFDYSGSEIFNYFNLISQEIKKGKRLAFEDIRTLVTHAVTFNVNYLVRPNWTLSKLIFDDDKTRNVNEIKMMLDYIYYYDYVKNVFNGYFSKRKILALSETEFDMILGKIDRQMFSEHTSDLIDNALVSIGEFFNEGGVNKTRIDTQTVELFLKEKDLMEQLFKLRRSIPADDKKKYDIEEIRKILYSKTPVQAAALKKDEDLHEINETASSEKKIETQSNETQTAAEEGVQETEITAEDSGLESESIDLNEAGTEDKTLDGNMSLDQEIEEESSELSTLDLLNEDEARKEEGDEEEERIEHESPDDFLKRYQTELKSLEDLEAQLDNFSSEDDLTFSELDEDEEEKPVEVEKNTPITEETIPAILEETQSEEKTEPETIHEEDETHSDELIIEEEELSFDDDIEPIDIESESAVPPARPNNDILSFLSDKEMEKIIGNVFNEDEEDFVNTMEKISESADYEAATEILKSVFFSYKVSPYSRDAVVLTNAVSNFFNQD